MKHLFASILALAALAQTPAPEPPTGSISGVVKDASTHAPLPGIPVSAGGAQATTGPEGQFTLRRIEPGRQWVSVYDNPHAASGGRYVLVNPGEEITGIEIFIKLGGTISGRVVDQEQHAVAGATVLLLEKRFEFGQPTYAPLLNAHTDRRGAYRLAPVPAERGLLVLVKKPIVPAGSMPADQEKRPRVPIPAYHPNSREIDGAEAVALAAGEDRRGVDIQMPLDPAFCIDGAMEATEAAPVKSVYIAERLPLASGWSLRPVTAAVTADGKFAACGFHSGEYEVWAGERAAYAEVVITDRDLQDVRLTARSAVKLFGEATWDPPPHDPNLKARILVGFSKAGNSQSYADDGAPRAQRAEEGPMCVTA
jgi:hypothetical protein